MDIKAKFKDFLLGKHRKKNLNYQMAVSSGKPVSEEVPKLIGRRAAWASKEGANYVEVAVENPAQLIMDKDDLISSAIQLGLNYNLHSSTQLGFGTAYAQQGRGAMGFNPAHNYLMKFLSYAGEFKEDLEKESKGTEFGQKTLNSINAHASMNTVPAEEERLATDVSVDPYGARIVAFTESIKNGGCRIWKNKDFMKQFWEGYVEDKLKKKPELEIIKLIRNTIPEETEKSFNKRLLGEYNPQRANNPQTEGDSYTEEDLERMDLERKMRETARLDKFEDAYEEIFNKLRKEFIRDPQVLELLVDRIRGLREDQFNQEAFIFREIMPRWMPNAKNRNIRRLWKEITRKRGGERNLKKLKNSLRGEEDMIEAVTAAYVWGHMTQEIGDYGEIKKFKRKETPAKLLKHYNLEICWEAHMAGVSENVRIWKPKSMIALSKAINREAGSDITKVTIDMEHIATQKVNPLWLINGNKERGYDGISNGDGKMIKIVHVTHPYIAGGQAGHSHGPIRKGDKLIFEYMYDMIKKGFAQGKDKAVVMYEMGKEKVASVSNLRLIMNMIEAGITKDDLNVEEIENIMDKEPEDLKEKLLQEFFGLSRQDIMHDWKNIHDHALDPLKGFLKAADADYTYSGQAATENRVPPEQWKKEEYR